MPELLLELLSEEIPARMQTRAAAELKRLAGMGLAEAGLAWDRIETFVTPRRLVLVVEGLPAAQPDVVEERRGPRVGAPDTAVEGFLRSAGLPRERLQTRETEKGAFHFAVIEQKGRKTRDVLPDVLTAALAGLSWPKSMRAATHDFRWVRPVHRLLCVFGGRTVPFAFGPITAGNATVGHRFQAPKPFRVKTFTEYAERLRNAFVVLDPFERRAVIWRDASLLARKERLSVKADEDLLDEVTGLVEWPVVRMGRIDEAFMTLPPEVLTAAMRTHQKYFACLHADGSLAPRFVMVAGTETTDGGTAVVAGNERVLRARLADARFFWDQDRKIRLDERIPALGERVYHAKLGTVADKAERMIRLARRLAPVCGADEGLARRAAELAKADLSTDMVGEFPELQGIMGRYYALDDGESPDVAEAVAEHYSPLGPHDRCPTAPVSVAVSLADKIDALVGFFAIGEKPTGSKDPYALRRSALGAIRLLLENKIRVELTQVLTFGYDQYIDNMRELQQEKHGKFLERGATVASILDFFAARLKVHLRDKGVRHDLISAVFAQRQTDLIEEFGECVDQPMPGHVDLIRVLARVDALEKFLSSDDGANLLVAYRRANNIVRIEEKRDGKSYDGGTQEEKLEQPEEKNLYYLLEQVLDDSKKPFQEEDFETVMVTFSKLRKPVDDFFDNVTVNILHKPQLRDNRLRLLHHVAWTMDQVADFSQIEGGER